MASPDEAIILAGGLGKRLRSAVGDVPKALAPVAGRPFLAYLLDNLAGQGFTRVVLATGYLGGQVEAAVGRAWRDMELVHSREPQPLGTGGAIVRALQYVRKAACFVLNGDTHLELDYTDFDAEVRRAGVPMGIALARVADTARYGAVDFEGARITGFAEKGRAGPGCINAGVYRIARSLLAGLAADTPFSFETAVLRPAAERGDVAAYARTHGFIDIGIPEDYQRAQRLLGGSQATAS